MSVVQRAPLASLEIENRWDDAHAARLSPAELLLYRSNLLGSDKRITNFGGGNTSAKIKEKDPLTGQDVEVLWVKGSGGDLGTMKLDGFATLYMEKLLSLEKFYKAGTDNDAVMVPLYALYELGILLLVIAPAGRVAEGQILRWPRRPGGADKSPKSLGNSAKPAQAEQIVARTPTRAQPGRQLTDGEEIP